MKLSQFKFKLPEDKIALHPTKYRDESRLMVLHRRTGEIEHKMFKDVLNYFDDMGVEISEASQDGPYLFQALLYGENLQKKTRTWTHMVTARGFFRTHAFLLIPLLETVSVGILAE